MVRIGVGAGFAGDRMEPAQDLAERGALDFLIFEGLAERTLAYGHQARKQNPAAGYNETLVRRMASVLPHCRAARTTVITNMGAANPKAAGAAVRDLARSAGLDGLRIAVVEGDDVTDLIDGTTALFDFGHTVAEHGRSVLGANAYTGIDGIVEALSLGADVIVTGRVADPSLFLAPLAHRLGWAADDFEAMGRGTLVGHLLECSCQITGGYFADPGRKEVKDIAYLGYPFAVVDDGGSAEITKLDGTGGCVTPLTVKEQLLYEVHDPAAYLTPDVTADFTGVHVSESGHDRVAVSGARGRERPAELKVVVGFDGGYLAEGEISYAGFGALDRARLAGEIVRERMTALHACEEAIRIDYIGVTSLHAGIAPPDPDYEPKDVRLRVALRTMDRAMAQTLTEEVESLWVAGPAGGGGYRGRVTPSVVTATAFLPREHVQHHVEVITA